jgi:hypothetical protein
LILVPAWTRRRSHAAWLALWLAVNPFVFGKPAQHRAWSTRAMLGEELQMSLTLIYWEQMVRYLERDPQDHGPRQ